MLIYLFYHGEGNDPKCRDFISKEDFIQEFSSHCKACTSGAESEQADYSENFLQLAHSWLSKLDGASDTKKFSEKYGMLNRLLIKFDREHDDLFSTDSGNIRPIRKLDDLMPYFLRKEMNRTVISWQPLSIPPSAQPQGSWSVSAYSYPSICKSRPAPRQTALRLTQKYQHCNPSCEVFKR